MTLKSVIKEIELHKKQPNLNFSLKEKTEVFTQKLFYTLFDTQTPVAENLEQLEVQFDELVNLACWQLEKPCKKIWDKYVVTIPSILQKLNLDAEAIVNCDPASLSIEEVYMAYPGFYAIAIYRLAHELHTIGFPLVPRLMTEYAHRLTGVDINPGAKIGNSFFIDHATGVVIGETAVIEDHVKIYQGVTLGALYVAKNLKQTKRHPTIKNNVTIYANATILGGDTVIGENTIIGGNAWVTSSIPANSKVFYKSEIQIKTTQNVS
ncbi:MAG: serine O-acetyltransferase [Cellulophaga sp.]|uniref:serine O-acetyltransferase n=1 Tax=unclassified Cellulophaga TaxID=2634405 RepID=UPI000C2BFF89|nr:MULTISPECIES: serine O-acetyltransferase [unclassified Cellulophaga]MDO6492588.1 serine O-acetyltransferase [Cellulophaga sp. 2_MG-2023]MDO6493690.1 serine O-acetyltransferase [Cellulophaga sp. 3_MG-2023]PKB44295.1 serine O-acetyltransferase [Cellulophaga sp. RHA19]